MEKVIKLPAKRNKKRSTILLQGLLNGLRRYIISIYFHAQISQKSPLMKILTRRHFCLLTKLNLIRFSAFITRV